MWYRRLVPGEPHVAVDTRQAIGAERRVQRHRQRLQRVAARPLVDVLVRVEPLAVVVLREVPEELERLRGKAREPGRRLGHRGDCTRTRRRSSSSSSRMSRTSRCSGISISCFTANGIVPHGRGLGPTFLDQHVRHAAGLVQNIDQREIEAGETRRLVELLAGDEHDARLVERERVARAFVLELFQLDERAWHECRRRRLRPGAAPTRGPAIHCRGLSESFRRSRRTQSVMPAPTTSQNPVTTCHGAPKPAASGPTARR